MPSASCGSRRERQRGRQDALERELTKRILNRPDDFFNARFTRARCPLCTHILPERVAAAAQPKPGKRAIQQKDCGLARPFLFSSLRFVNLVFLTFKIFSQGFADYLRFASEIDFTKVRQSSRQGLAQIEAKAATISCIRHPPTQQRDERHVQTCIDLYISEHKCTLWTRLMRFGRLYGTGKGQPKPPLKSPNRRQESNLSRPGHHPGRSATKLQRPGRSPRPHPAG
jgi:hypothetical protein